MFVSGASRAPITPDAASRMSAAGKVTSDSRRAYLLRAAAGTYNPCAPVAGSNRLRGFFL
jgi:hypothetical protein